MTYGTTQRRSESNIPATESERPVRRSERPAKRFESLHGRQRVRIGGSRGQLEGLRGQLEDLSACQRTREAKQGVWRVKLRGGMGTQRHIEIKTQISPVW